MATAVAPYRFTVRDFHRMGESGIFAPEARVELIEGEIVEMTPIGARHAACVNRLNHLLSQRCGSRVVVGVQNPVVLADLSEPQPDVALLRPRDDFYAEGHPGAGDILLLVEVADSSQAWDRDVKIPLYARQGVPEAWLVDLAAEIVEIHRSPSAEGFREIRRRRRGEQIELSAPGIGVVLGVDEILG